MRLQAIEEKDNAYFCIRCAENKNGYVNYLIGYADNKNGCAEKENNRANFSCNCAENKNDYANYLIGNANNKSGCAEIENNRANFLIALTIGCCLTKRKIAGEVQASEIKIYLIF